MTTKQIKDNAPDEAEYYSDSPYIEYYCFDGLQWFAWSPFKNGVGCWLPISENPSNKREIKPL